MTQKEQEVAEALAPLVAKAETAEQWAEIARLEAEMMGGPFYPTSNSDVAVCSAPANRYRAPEGECAYCDRERAAGNEHHPSHDASPRCESGKRSHCTCDTCW